MTNHQLTMLRKLLFFTVAEAAELVSLTSERAWIHWEAGKRKVPDDVAAKMWELVGYREDLIDEVDYWTMTYYADRDGFPGSPEYWRPHQSAMAVVFSRNPGLAFTIR